jgi:hypothetical protein
MTTWIVSKKEYAKIVKIKNMSKKLFFQLMLSALIIFGTYYFYKAYMDCKDATELTPKEYAEKQIQKLKYRLNQMLTQH